MFRRLMALSVLVLIAPLASATEYTKQTTLLYVGRQGTRPIQPETANREFLTFTASSPNWTITGGSGGTVCPQGGAVLPAEDSMMRAIALTALAAGLQVIINVDNSLTTFAGQCQVTTLYIVGN